MLEKNSRKKELDVYKGVLIILVVLGHSYITEAHYVLDRWENYIYIFHMPAFFVIGGILTKKIDKKEWKTCFKKRILRYLKPYMLYVFGLGILVIIYRILFEGYTKEYILYGVVHLIYGGRKLIPFQVGPCWFLTCYLFTFILFQIIESIGNRIFKLLLYTAVWSIGHLQAFLFQDWSLPLAIDVVFIAIVWYAIGYHFKELLNNRKIMFSGIILSIMFIVLRNILKIPLLINYGLEILCHYNKSIILDIIIPLSFFELGYYLSFTIARKFEYLSRLFEYLSRRTIEILGLHLICAFVVLNLLNSSNEVLYVLTGVVIPCGIHTIAIKLKKICQLCRTD